MRPFAVGDLVVLGCNGVTKTIVAIRGTLIELSDGWSRDIDSLDIVTIRTPRKGGKEARDIVAKLKWKERELKYKCNTYRHGKDAICKQIYFVATQEIALVRELIATAKSMLGGRNT